MFTSDSQQPDSPALDGRLKKLRSACDACHAAKVRCSGEATCSRCLRDNVPCHYSYRAHQGKPKGSLNKKTIERIKAARAAAESEAQPDHITSQGSSVCPRPADDVLDFIDMPPSTCNNSPDPVTATPSSHFPLMGETFPTFGADDLDSFLNAYQTPPQSCSSKPVGDIPVASEMDPGCIFVGTPSSSSREYTDAAASCCCVRTMTRQINHVHAAATDRSAAALDHVLHHTRETASCVSRFLQCHTCGVEVQVYVLAAVVLSLLLEIMHPLTDSSLETCRPRAQIRVGNYDMSGQLGDVLEKVIVRSMITKLRQVVDKFEMRVEFLRSETAQVDFLKSEARRLKRGFERIGEETATVL
ncbi:Zn(2)-C6 fungal-type DNA-binding domain protein [Metarhizium robertsii ARSEF 23]|uniref:Zn(2)-C6 fungal-type DNA-binding domain protein n=1 Tax=Metarhizium robertsii (strain ARSEF 23 / ATCC MYA-3075) TaxID=655844 RepID=E9EKW6_METRA|nr:Zn(2)-C6 fungal-type DNA-binding domain protein [Metarhizium robertsii ARSEF 23]EFZ03901.1 Zn(2)-C6 fungal-type DNA-binding domain protein [Metarhizium robertsii ARSEF 23]